MKIKIIDASSTTKVVHLTPREAANTNIICQGFNRVDIFLPSADHFPRTTEPLIITREKINQKVFIHSPDVRFQNSFDLEMKMLSLDMYFSKTLMLVKEDSLNKEWHVISTGQSAYLSRTLPVTVYGTATYTQGTSTPVFTVNGFQTSATGIGARSFLYDQGFVSFPTSTTPNIVTFNQPGNYEFRVTMNFLSVSTEPTTLRFRLRQVGDFAYAESFYDMFFVASSGTQRHSADGIYAFVLPASLGTNTSYNTSGSSRSSLGFLYDAVVEGNGTWYTAPDLPANNNPGWQNRIIYDMVLDPDIQSYFYGTAFGTASSSS